ncbi:unnamed protein product, partial [Thlaspi arvense]
MEEASEMEVEVQNRQSCGSGQNVKRFGLKNSIPTNFGSDYVFQIVPKVDWTAIAVSLSTNTVKLYSPVTGQYYGECKGHSGTVNQIAFSSDSAASPHVLHSCSSDGTIRSWDTRSFQQVSCIDAENGQKVFSFSYGGAGDNLLAGGCKKQVLLWDWRNSKQVACLEESHMDDVTQIGFLGDCYQKLWCLTHIETLSIWNWQDGSCEVNLEKARELASDSWSQDNVDYFVDCHCPGGEDLWVIGGTCAGTIGYFPVKYKRPGSIGPAEAILGGGHIDVVRSVVQMPSEYGGGAGLFGWTGGEDGRLCCWLSDADINRSSWTSSELVVKPPRNRMKNRHSPYYCLLENHPLVILCLRRNERRRCTSPTSKTPSGSLAAQLPGTRAPDSATATGPLRNTPPLARTCRRRSWRCSSSYRGRRRVAPPSPPRSLKGTSWNLSYNGESTVSTVASMFSTPSLRGPELSLANS